jgi:hypothetical protein
MLDRGRGYDAAPLVYENSARAAGTDINSEEIHALKTLHQSGDARHTFDARAAREIHSACLDGQRGRLTPVVTASRCCSTCSVAWKRSEVLSQTSTFNARLRTRPEPCFASRSAHRPHSPSHTPREPRDTLEIFCSEGSIRTDVLNEGRLKIKTAVGERVESHPTHLNVHMPLIDDFARAVIGGTSPRVDGRVGLEVSRVLELVYADSPTTDSDL